MVLIRPWEADNIFVQALEKEGYPIYRVPVAKRARVDGRDYLRVFRCHRIIHSLLKDGSYDLVHTHGYFADIVGIPAAKRLRIPRISTCHGFISNNLKYKFYNACDLIALRFSNNIISVSHGIKSTLMKSGIKDSQITVIRNAVNGNYHGAFYALNRQKIRKLYGIGGKEFVVGYIGRLSEEKGIRYLIEACSRLNELDLPTKVLIIGEGPQKQELQDLTIEKSMDHNVFFTGFQRDIENWLPAMDIFVLPSLTEGTPMALLEAMAFGIPVVASAVGDVPQVVDSERNGILVNPGKPGEINNAIQLLYKNETMRKRFSAEAQEKIKEKYNVEDWTRKIEAEYLKMEICRES